MARFKEIPSDYREYGSGEFKLLGKTLKDLTGLKSVSIIFLEWVVKTEWVLITLLVFLLM